MHPCVARSSPPRSLQSGWSRSRRSRSPLQPPRQAEAQAPRRTRRRDPARTAPGAWRDLRLGGGRQAMRPAGGLGAEAWRRIRMWRGSCRGRMQRVLTQSWETRLPARRQTRRWQPFEETGGAKFGPKMRRVTQQRRGGSDRRLPTHSVRSLYVALLELICVT